MNEIKIERIYQSNYTATVLNAIKQKWSATDKYNFIGNKKKQHLFLCLTNCSAIYTLKDGSTHCAPQNSVVYIPEESEYIIKFTECNDSDMFNCIAVNFKLYDDNQNPFCLDRNIKVYSINNFPQVLDLFHKLADNYQHAVLSPMKIAGLFYILLSEIAGHYHRKKTIQRRYSVIAKGIDALENQCVNDLTVNDLAKLCNVSPVYFTKLFKEYSGITPNDYKLNTLIARAKQYLVYGNNSIGEISSILGFSSATYFCRVFKKKTGLTPMQYMKSEFDRTNDG